MFLIVMIKLSCFLSSDADDIFDARAHSVFVYIRIFTLMIFIYISL
jgi:hypothetical protein